MSYSNIIHIDPQPIYDYYNATKDWQKERIDVHIDKYLKTLVQFLFDKLHYQDSDLYQIAHKEFVDNTPQIAIYGSKPEKKVELGSVIQKLETCPYKIVYEGNNLTGKVSFVTLNFEMKNILLLKDAEQMVVKMYDGIDLTDTSLVDITPIDKHSLESFLKGNTNFKRQNEKIQEYNNQARQIKLVSDYLGGVFPQVISESDYGRRYYKGFSLQNVSKIIRNAALGDNYEYDLNSAVYSIKLNYAAEITDKKFTHTSEYIELAGKYKDAIRKRLALDCFDTNENDKYFENRVKVIKHAITAIGFGATKTGHGFFDKKNNWQHSSLFDIFCYTIKDENGTKKIPYQKVINHKTNEKKLSIDLFLEDPWMKQFIEEQQEMSKLIVKACIDNEVISKETHPFLVDGRNALNSNRVMAYFFQKTERLIMDRTHEFIEKSGVKVLLRVHDAIYVDRKIKLGELHTMLIEKFISSNLSWLGSKIISFEETFNEGYSYDESDESDIEDNWTRLTGVSYTPPPKQKKVYQQKSIEGFYDANCQYEQLEEEELLDD